MHERQVLNTTSGPSSMKPKPFNVTLRSSIEDVHVVTLPAHISTADQANTYELDVWSRFNGFPELEDINQLEPRLVESRLSIIDRQDRILQAQLDKISHDRKSMQADVKKYEDLAEYLGKCEYGNDKNVISKADIIADAEFLLDEKAAQKLELDELLEKVNALKSQVEYRVKKLAQGITQLKTGYDKDGLQGEDDEAKVCLRNLLMKMGPFGTRLGETKIPMLVSADKYKKSKDNCREFRSSKTMSQKIRKDGIKQMNIQTESGNGSLNVRASSDEKKKYTLEINDKNTNTQSQDINRRYKDIKSKLNTGRKPVERKVGKASFEQSVASSEIATKKRQVKDDVLQRNVFQQGNKKDKRRKVIKSKIDTGRNNTIRHKDMKSKVAAPVSVGNKQANASDMKRRNEGKSSFANKPLLPQIKSNTQKRSAINGQHVSEKRIGSYKLAPLPKGSGHDVNDLTYPHGVRNGVRTPLSVNLEGSTPLPPIKSACVLKDNRNDGVMWISFAPSPPPRPQPSPSHILDSAERTQHRT